MRAISRRMACSRRIWREFREDDGLRVAILTGAGERAFCAGSDIKDNYVARPGRGTAGIAISVDVRPLQADYRRD